MRVLHLLGTLRPSGMERMLVSAAPYWRELGVQSVVVGQGASHPFRADIEASGYEVRVIRPQKSLGGWYDLYRVIKTADPDVVHIHTEGAYAPVAWVARRAVGGRRPIIRTVHNVFQPKGADALRRRIQAQIGDSAIDVLLAVSADVAENERVTAGRKSQVLMNWVGDEYLEIQRARSLRRSPAIASAVIVGNSSPIKNQIRALRAVESAGWSLYFHGDESHASSEEVEVLARLERGGRIRYRGTDAPHRSLTEASAFLMPSRNEGMSIALAEAIVAGLPILVNDSPGQQWARRFEGVSFLQDRHDDWVSALALVAESAPATLERRSEELSAKTGASATHQVYTSAIEMRGS